jgi:hypothetical protein
MPIEPILYGAIWLAIIAVAYAGANTPLWIAQAMWPGRSPEIPDMAKKHEQPASTGYGRLAQESPVQDAPRAAETPAAPGTHSVTRATRAKRTPEAERQARYRERHGDAYRERHAAYCRQWRAGQVGKRLERRQAPAPT